MKNYLLLTVVAIFSFSVHPNVNTETKEFSILYKGDEIGIMTATKVISGNTVTFTSHSEVSARILMKVNVDSKYSATLREGNLDRSTANVIVNNRTNAESLTRKQGNQYQFMEYGELENTFSSTIQYTSVMLLIEEPVNRSRAYSEQKGTFHTIRKTGSHSYEKEDEKGRVCTYNYENGVLVNGKINSGWVNFDLIAKN